MANLDYYAHEINDLLRQISINRDSIGMQRVNVLPMSDGELDVSSSDLPSTAELTVEGRSSGEVTVAVSGVSDHESYNSISIARLTPTGTEDGLISPGKYRVSLSGVAVEQMPFPENVLPEIYIDVSYGNHEHGTDTIPYGESEIVVTIPEDFTLVDIRLQFSLDEFDLDGSSVSCTLYPFVRLEVMADEPFEPYKPDLQTQINALKGRVTALEESSGGSRRSVIVGNMVRSSVETELWEEGTEE